MNCQYCALQALHPRGCACSERSRADLLQLALRAACEELRSHNAEYDHVTPQFVIDKWEELSA